MLFVHSFSDKRRAYIYWDMMADWLERSPSNTESMDSSLPSDGYHVGTLS